MSVSKQWFLIYTPTPDMVFNIPAIVLQHSKCIVHLLYFWLVSMWHIQNLSLLNVVILFFVSLFYSYEEGDLDPDIFSSKINVYEWDKNPRVILLTEKLRFINRSSVCLYSGFRLVKLLFRHTGPYMTTDNQTQQQQY